MGIGRDPGMNGSMIKENETASGKELNPLVRIKRKGIMVLVLIGAFFGLFLLGILHYQNVYDETYIHLTPSPPEKGSKFQVYVPKDLEDSFAELKRMLPPKLIKKIKEESDVTQYHLNLGMWMRNFWGLWQGSRLKEYFEGIGVNHPDDMTSIILRSFHRRLNNQEIGVSRQVEIYQKFQEFITRYLENLKREGKVEENGQESRVLNIDVNDLLGEFMSELPQNGSH
jgi:hypothetical protein